MSAGDVQLSENFRLSEYLVHETPPPELQPMIPRVNVLSQWLRDITGQPLQVTSYYRSPARQAVVNPAVKDSQHEKGEAVDLLPVGAHKLPLDEIARRVILSRDAGTAPKFGQLIFYRDQGHVHASLPHTDGRPDGQLLFSPGLEEGTRVYQRFSSLADLGIFTAGGGAVALLLLIGAAVFF